MRLILLKKSFFIFLIVLFFSFAFVTKGNAQCSITTSRNTTGLSCGTSPLSACGGVLYIGDGTNTMILTMTSNVDLSCLGPIRFIIKNGASVDFSTGNYDLQLAAGSSIEIESGGQLGAATNCSASDLVKIGGINVASCNGSGGGVLTDFPGLVSSGGYSSVNATASPSSFCDSASPTLTATANPSSGVTFKWYDAQSGGNLLDTGATYSPGTIYTTKTYYVEAVYSGYNTVRKAVTVTANQTPSGLSYTISSPSYCLGNAISANSATLTSSGSSSVTYSVSPVLPSGLSLNTSTGTITGTPTVAISATNYTVTASNTCGNTTSVLNITVNTNSIAPTSITGTSTICSGNSTTLSLNGGTAGAGATAKWYTGSCGGTLVGTGNSVIVSPTTTTVYYVRYEGTCNTTTCASTTVTVTATPTIPGTITQPTNTCASTSGNTFSIAAVSGATSYTWSVTGTGWSVTSGGTTTSATITIGSGVGTVSVSATNACGTSLTSTTGNITPTSVPVTPGTITQPTNTCASASGNTFSIAAVSGATSYTWSVTGTGWSVTSGGTTTSATIMIGSGVGTVSVSATNACGTSLTSTTGNITPTNAPAIPGTITQPTNTCASTSGNTFSIAAVSGATSYTWSVTGSGWSVTSGGTTTSATITIGSGVGTVSVSATNACGTSLTSTTGNITPTSAPVTPGTITQPTNTCASTSGNTFSIAAVSGATSYTWSVTGTGWSVTSGGSTTSATITIGSGVGTVSVTATNACGTSSASTTGNITAVTVSAPTAGTPTNPNCAVPTGSVPLSGLPTSGTIVQTGSHDDTYIITGGGTQTITGLLPGNYNFAVSNGGCTSATVNVTIASPVTNTWSSGSWSNGTPTINQRLVFASDYTNVNDVDIEGCSCQVTGSAAVTIKSGRTLKIENGVDIASTGSLTFENNASLVQINDNPTINSGNVNYKRYTAAVKRYDFTYWSSPVAGQTLKNLSPNTLYDKYYGYNPSTGWMISYNGVATMEAGKGYLIRAPQTFSITVAAIDTNPVFIGKPNNGVVSFSIAGDQVHLLGNPYPSAIDADAFLTENASKLEGTLYFWTHNSAPSNAVAGDATYNYTTSDYATYNRTGGVSTALAAAPGGTLPNGKIAAGQGFFAPASTAGGTVVFKNSMRLSSTGTLLNNSQFFKLSGTSKMTTNTEAEKNRIWLNLTNKEGAFKQTLVGYLTGATNDYDGGFDGVTYDGNQFVDFYSVNQGVNLSIQGRALPFVKKDSVALGYKSTIKGEFQISIDHTDGTLATQNIFLEDTDLKVLHDLKKEAYTFSTEKGVFNTRFILRYVDKNAVEPVVDTPQVDETVLVSVSNSEIAVGSTEDLISKIIIYDISGKILYEKEDVAANNFVVQNLISSQQVLFINVVLANGKTTSTKIIY
ncbi:T9SS sorting signal type C domain-containing protein [Flavobacterium sufflavum]|uniref:T9SS sorting signal type C domain-containing protein n=1 Tax=Flavobacterium sufflavum TaxID=1921138 RepID=A0A3S2XI48_9FLAO|nr:T9SS sorting signal type C domain-containing protein [Flavobacterium sufflavum]RVT79777.1 T9SS sorting signal type C domain-containing protein [Flavobacterium sufflavum]